MLLSCSGWIEQEGTCTWAAAPEKMEGCGQQTIELPSLVQSRVPTQ